MKRSKCEGGGCDKRPEYILPWRGLKLAFCAEHYPHRLTPEKFWRKTKAVKV